jgi:hypothetical protein
MTCTSCIGEIVRDGVFVGVLVGVLVGTLVGIIVGIRVGSGVFVGRTTTSCIASYTSAVYDSAGRTASPTMMRN